MNTDQWYARKTSYGVSRTVHIILREIQRVPEKVGEDDVITEKIVLRLLCKPKGAYKEEGLIKVENFKQTKEEDDRCPECLSAYVKKMKP